MPPLLATLGDLWAEINRPVPHNQHPEVDFSMKALSKCYLAGRCLCGALGKRLKKFARCLDQPFRPMFPAHSENRDLLVNGGVVCLLVGAEASLDEPFAGGDGVAELGLPESQRPAVAPGAPPPAAAARMQWLHIGRCCSSPWKATYHRMQLAAPFAPAIAGGKLKVGSPVKLASTFDFLTKCEALSTLDLDLRWFLVVFHLRRTSELVGDLDASYVKVDVLGDGLLHEIWNPARSCAAAPRKPASEWASLAADFLVDCGSDADSNDADASAASDVDIDAASVSADGGSASSADSDAYQSLSGSFFDLGDGSADSQSSEPERSGLDSEASRSSSSKFADAPAGIAADVHVPGGLAVAPSAPPPPPQVAAAAEREQAPGLRGEAASQCILPGLGTIAYYEKAGGFMQATCRLHGCKLRRTCSATARPPKGRPLGLLAYWLQCQSDFADKVAHMASGVGDSQMERASGRQWLRGQPGATALFEAERQCALGEDSEPERKP